MSLSVQMGKLGHSTCSFSSQSSLSPLSPKRNLAVNKSNSFQVPFLRIVFVVSYSFLFCVLCMLGCKSVQCVKGVES